jgi:tight adherence protein B
MTDLIPSNWLPALLVFATATLSVFAGVFLLEAWGEVRKKQSFKRQLKEMTDRPAGGRIDESTSNILRKTAGRDSPLLESALALFPQRHDVGILLEQADLSWTVGTFLMMSVGVAATLALTSALAGGGPAIMFALGLIGLFLPSMYVRRRKKKRILAFEEQFPEAIELLGRSIRAGHAFATGLKVVADESPDPVATEFRRVFEEQKFGLPLEDSMLGVADRIELVDVRIFVTAILVQREVGGNLAEILDQIAYTIRERFMIQRQVRVYTAQGRMTGYLLSFMPVAMGVLLYTMSPEYMLILFEDPMGRLMLGGALVLQFIGFLVIRRIIDIEI